MAYSGKYRPTNPRKYKGDPTNVIYRSLWERKFMQWCDLNSDILQWGSEEFFIPYRSPVDKRVHRYFPDFYVQCRTTHGTIAEYVIEVKQLKQTAPPIKKKRVTKKYITEVTRYAINEAKWKAANKYCKQRNMQFKILTEKELKV